MSSKSFVAGIVVLVMAACAFASMNQNWTAVVGNGVLQSGAGLSAGFAGASISKQQAVMGWMGGSMQSTQVGVGQSAVAGGLGGIQSVGQLAGGTGYQNVGGPVMNQGLQLGAGQILGGQSAGPGGAHATQGAFAQQSQVIGSWGGVSMESQHAGIFQSGTVIHGPGGRGIVLQGAYVVSSQSQQ